VRARLVALRDDPTEEAGVRGAARARLAEFPLQARVLTAAGTNEDDALPVPSRSYDVSMTPIRWEHAVRRSETIFAVGDSPAPRELAAMSGEDVPVPDPERLVHLQLRRFAGCPVCSLHLRSVVRRAGEIEAAGVREVVVFHSTDEELRKYAADLPFAVVGDPDKKLYREFGVESSARAALDPRAWPGLARAVSTSMWGVLRRRERLAPVMPNGGQLGLPADFLFAPDGRLLAVKYGEHAYDQWTVDELLAHARTARTAREADLARPAAPAEAPAAASAEAPSDTAR
jgi:hypothetical protein